jgi:hypothetical protein
MRARVTGFVETGIAEIENGAVDVLQRLHSIEFLVEAVLDLGHGVSALQDERHR